MWYDLSVTLVTHLWLYDCHMIFPMLHLSNNLKEKKRNINIDLAVLPSHDTLLYSKSKRKEKNINNDLAVLPSHNIIRDKSFYFVYMNLTKFFFARSFIDPEHLLTPLSWLGKMAKSLFIFTFLFLFFWTYYIGRSAGKSHVTSVT